MTAKRSEITKIVYIRGFRIPEEVPIEFTQDVGLNWKIQTWMPHPSQVSKPWEMCTFNPNFPELDGFKSIVKHHGLI